MKSWYNWTAGPGAAGKDSVDYQAGHGLPLQLLWHKDKHNPCKRVNKKAPGKFSMPSTAALPIGGFRYPQAERVPPDRNSDEWRNRKCRGGAGGSVPTGSSVADWPEIRGGCGWLRRARARPAALAALRSLPGRRRSSVHYGAGSRITRGRGHTACPRWPLTSRCYPPGGCCWRDESSPCAVAASAGLSPGPAWTHGGPLGTRSPADPAPHRMHGGARGLQTDRPRRSPYAVCLRESPRTCPGGAGSDPIAVVAPAGATHSSTHCLRSSRARPFTVQ